MMRRMKRLPPLSRRTLLRGVLGGASVAVALPILDAMLDGNGEAFADGSALPCRFVTFMFGNGVRLDRFVPAASYPNPWVVSEELQPLADRGVKDHVSVLTGFDNRSAYSITHHEGMTVFSGHDLQDVGQGQGFFSNAGGATIDQVIADAPGMADQTTIPSIQLGVSREPSDVDFGTTTHNLSHRGYLQPLPPEYQPQKVWTNLFGSFVPPEDPQGPLRTSVLDAVREQTAKLDARIGAADRVRLEAHLDGVRELEQKILALPPLCASPDMPTVVNEKAGGVEPIRAVCEAMSDLIAYAFTCDVTRVASLLFVEPAALTVYAELSQTQGYHELTHSQSQTVQDTLVHEGVIYAIDNFAYLVRRLLDTPDAGGDGSLLDSTVLFCSSECSEGYNHSIDNQPMLVAGDARGRLKQPGIHAATNGDNPTDVLLFLAQLFDPAITTVGSGPTASSTPFSLLGA